MQSSQENPNAKRQLESDEPLVEEMKALKIDDLNDFCMLNIFGRLDVQSLLNVAHTSKRLRSLALEVYQRKFGAKTVSIKKCGTVRVSDATDFTVQESGDDIQICGLKTCLAYLRCFGPFIHGLSIAYGNKKSKYYAYVHEYVNNFCAESLVTFTFRHLPNITIEQFQKVFVNVRDVSFADCDLGDKWLSFVRWFPNLRSLDFGDVRMVYRSIEKPFPNLENLSINELEVDDFTATQIADDLLNGVNQLKSLEIGFHEDSSGMSITELLDLIKGSPSMSKLSVCAVYGRASEAEIQRFISEHPALVELGLENCTFTPDDAIALIPQLGSLKRFEFHTQVNYCSDERSIFESQLDNLGWDLSIGDTGCFLPTMTYDMYVTVTRRE